MTSRTELFNQRAEALADQDLHRDHTDDSLGYDGEQLDREERAALRRVAGLSTELEDITEVEYRQLRLERVVLAAVWTDGTAEDADNSMRELAALAETAGSTVLAGLVQRRAKPDTGTYLGSGKAEELRDIVIAEGADTVICDTELTPSQRRALEDVVKVKVIDRTALISTSSPSTRSPRRARPRSSWRSCSTCFRACAAGVSRCPARLVARRQAVRAWAREAPVRPRSSWTGVASTSAWPSSAARSRR